MMRTSSSRASLLLPSAMCALTKWVGGVRMRVIDTCPERFSLCRGVQQYLFSQVAETHPLSNEVQIATFS